MLTDRSSLGSGQRAPSSASWTVCGALSGNLPCFAVPTTLPCSLLPRFHFGGCSFSCLVFFMASILAGGVSSPSTRSSLRAALPQEAEQHQEDDHGDRHAEQPKENRHDLVPAGRSDVDGPNPGIGSFGNHATSARPHFVAIDRGDKAVSPLDGGNRGASADELCHTSQAGYASFPTTHGVRSRRAHEAMQRA